MKEFAEFLKSLRYKNHLSQVSACEGICSRREYQRYENDEAEPSLMHLRLLSIKFGYDFVAYYSLLSNHNGEMNIYRDRQKLISLAESGKFSALHDFINTLKKEQAYSVPINRNMLDYYDALFYASSKKYDISNKLCMAIINREDRNATLKNPCGSIFSTYAIYAVQTIALNYANCGKELKMIDISTQLANKIEALDRDFLSNYQDNLFRRNMHQNILLNLSYAHYQMTDYTSALDCVDAAIDYSKEYKTSYQLHKLLRQKMRCCYQLNHISEAKSAYDTARALYSLFEPETLAAFENTIDTDYPLIRA